MSDEIHLDSTDSGKTARIRQALAGVDAGIRAKLQADIDAEAALHIAAARADLQSMPTHSTKSTGLRQRIAEGVVEKSQFQGPDHPGAMINTFVDDINETPIPRGIETIKGWRHPVFGRREDPWVAQKPQYQWFTPAMESAEAGLTERFTRTLDAAAEEIARA